MKLNHFWLASLLILDFAYDKAYSEDVEQGSTDNPTNGGAIDESRTQEKDEQINKFVQKGHDKDDVSISLFESDSEVREYILDRLREIYSMLKSRKIKQVMGLPEFENPLKIDGLNQSYKMADVNFTNVRVIGLQNFQLAKVEFGTANNRTMDFNLTIDNLSIEGKYKLINIFKMPSEGSFTIKLQNNVTYHETIGNRSLKYEVDIATSKSGIRYGESDSDYRDLGFFTQIFRAPISCPMINKALKKVGKEIGHKIRPILTSKLYEQTAMNMNNITVLETLIRSLVMQVRNLTMKDPVSLNLTDTNTEFRTDYSNINYTVQSINLTNINKFEIERIKFPNRTNVDATLHNTKTNGKVGVEFVKETSVDPNDKSVETKSGSNNSLANVTLLFNVTDLAVNLTLKWNDKDTRFDIISDENWNVTVTNITTVIATLLLQDQNDLSQINDALHKISPNLATVIGNSFSKYAKAQINSILHEA